MVLTRDGYILSRNESRKTVSSYNVKKCDDKFQEVASHDVVFNLHTFIVIYISRIKYQTL